MGRRNQGENVETRDADKDGSETAADGMAICSGGIPLPHSAQEGKRVGESDAEEEPGGMMVSAQLQ